MKNILVAIGSRANFGSIKSVLASVHAHPNLNLKIMTFASAVLPKYGNLEEQMRISGFPPDYSLETQIEGDSVSSMAESTGLALLKIPGVIRSLKPDYVITVGDRYETMATAISASYMNVPLIHTMGGEVTGSIDESIRHAITKLSHIHFVATEQSRINLIQMGEKLESIFVTGCPRIDLAKEARNISIEDLQVKASAFGVGDEIDFRKPFLMISQHPVTSEFSYSAQQMTDTLNSVSGFDLPLLILWPNADAGSDNISKVIRRWTEINKRTKAHFYRNLPPEIYLKLMDLTSCLIGNSSSAIREGAYLGTPSVNVGTRQSGREHGENVTFVQNEENQIKSAIKKQLSHGKFHENLLYGSGNAGKKIAEIVSSLHSIDTQKILSFPKRSM